MREELTAEMEHTHSAELAFQVDKLVLDVAGDEETFSNRFQTLSLVSLSSGVGSSLHGPISWLQSEDITVHLTAGGSR